jgi:TPR repeat protein
MLDTSASKQWDDVKTSGLLARLSLLLLASSFGCGAHGPGAERDTAPRPDTAEGSLESERLACDGGEMQACMRLGVRCAEGLGVSRDEARAVQLYQRACSGGDMLGCGALGVMYDEEHPLVRRPREA